MTSAFVLGVVGEAWEAHLAALTLDDAARWLPPGTDIVVPPELAGLAGRLPTITVGAPPHRFRPYQEIANGLRRDMAGTDLLLLAAGTTARSPTPVRRTGAAWEQPRCVAWIPATAQAGAIVLDFVAPPHRPPAVPRHVWRRVGALDVWTADTGDGYFGAVCAAETRPGRPVWWAYGSGRPVFAYNTNRFDDPPPDPHDDYVILASGLLGLKSVIESGAPAGARVVVYDINPDQLAWTRFVLRRAQDTADLPTLIRLFEAAHEGVRVRAPMPHERANADEQARWYSRHRRRLAALATGIEFRFVEADLLTAPGPVLSMLSPDRRTFFMYLDLFIVWHVDDPEPWIIEFPQLARSLEAEVRRRAPAASFLPGAEAGPQTEGSPLLRTARR